MQDKTKRSRRAQLPKAQIGQITLHVPFPKGAPMFVKDCPVCEEPAPYTSIHQFACKACNYIFH